MNSLLPKFHVVDPYEGFVPPPDSNNEEFQLGHGIMGGASPLFREIVSQVRPYVAVEVGSWLGGSAVTTAKAMQELCSPGCGLLCVDPWTGLEVFWDPSKPGAQAMLRLKNGYPQLYYYFLANIVKFGVQDVVVPLPLCSVNAAEACQLLGVVPDLVYIDGLHDEYSTWHDIEAWRKAMSPSAVIFGDDYWAKDSAVGRAVHTHFNDGIWTFNWRDINGVVQPSRFWVYGGDRIDLSSLEADG